MRVIRRAGAVGTVMALVALAGACSPQSGVESAYRSVCTPTGELWDRLTITFEAVPSGSSLLYERLVEYPDDAIVDERTFTEGIDAVPGWTASVTAAQQGRCIHLTPSGGFTFRYQPVWTTNVPEYLVNQGYRGGFPS
jgi:hypothetical protein